MSELYCCKAPAMVSSVCGAFNSTDLEDSGRVNAQLTSQSKSDAVLEQVVGRLSLEPTVSAASWSVEPVVE
jgi:putative Mg2+ transporter-C (MgtC) family protein